MGREDARSLWAEPHVQFALQSYWNSENYKARINRGIIPRDSSPNHTDFMSLRAKGYMDVPVNITEVEKFLDGPIHPIFDREHWLTGSLDIDHAYLAMKPALRILTELLSRDKSLEWFARVYYGTSFRTPENQHLSPYLETYGEKEKKPKSIEKTREVLRNKAGHIKFMWVVDSFSSCLAKTCANIPSLLRNLGQERRVSAMFPNVQVDYRPCPTILLPLNFYFRLLASDQYSACENFRFQLVLVQLILHELGHAWWKFWQNRGREMLVYKDEFVAEAGFSVVRTIFGGYPSTIDNMRSTTGVGPMILCREQEVIPIVTPIRALVPMKWVLQWFHQDTWCNFGALVAEGKLSTPTVVGCPEVFQIDRYENKVWRRELWKCEPDLNNTGVCRVTSLLDTWLSFTCRNPLEFYQPIWQKEAKQAFKDGTLAAQFYDPGPSMYKDLFEDFLPPEWARESKAELVGTDADSTDSGCINSNAPSTKNS